MGRRPCGVPRSDDQTGGQDRPTPGRTARQHRQPADPRGRGRALAEARTRSRGEPTNLRTVIRPAIDLADRRFVGGTEESRSHAREEAAEQIRLYQQPDLAMMSQLPELPRAELTPLRFGRVETTAGEFFAVIRGVVAELLRSSAVAWYVDERNEIVWLERTASGPKSRAEPLRSLYPSRGRTARAELMAPAEFGSLSPLRAAHNEGGS